MYSDTAKFVIKLHIKDRIEKLKEKWADTQFKDHKQNFWEKNQARLIKPTKTKESLVSKIFENITS